jgi:hypothetical protein
MITFVGRTANPTKQQRQGFASRFFFSLILDIVARQLEILRAVCYAHIVLVHDLSCLTVSIIHTSFSFDTASQQQKTAY